MSILFLDKHVCVYIYACIYHSLKNPGMPRGVTQCQLAKRANIVSVLELVSGVILHLTSRRLHEIGSSCYLPVAQDGGLFPVEVWVIRRLSILKAVVPYTGNGVCRQKYTNLDFLDRSCKLKGATYIYSEMMVG